MQLTHFNSMPVDDATTVLLACCDVPAWAETVREGRPYADLADLLTTADTAARKLADDEVDRALAAHPRIGERARGDAASAQWSRREQGAVGRDQETLDALAAGNRAYEDRFGRVFLICATGLSGSEVLTALRDRLEHDDQTEKRVVADELRKIALVRLRNLLDEGVPS
jgi:2-oxo-4-hydroxy-4-carboxy-5-ureidoimidazoline decarboxylase